MKITTVVESPLLKSISSIQHAFGTNDEPIPQLFSKSWESKKPIWQQVHGISISHVKSSQQDCGPVDALYTSVYSIPIGVVTADCVPILLAHSSGKTVAAVHAGWRGTRAHILEALWNELKKQGEKPRDWFAAVGPAIGPCCYEISEDLEKDFLREFSEMEKSQITPRPRFLDLPAINAAELRRIGIKEIDLVRFCTRCSQNPRFHSFRREGKGTRQYSLIQIINNL